ncbi:HNH endonuclease family protein [Streptosporangium sp. 'caverna']|uniref:HNH endonuclease family protein n=1 Tax=Streptosporangium sp. 'caverna' TaxID=2202249 RepID=UPI000D7E13D0|nr:HNH endonuclease family protein [Streptosporangium sp. 'caverna']AWS48038.1 HNH endonuclease [Streptosporangium sp. 'caverna']
MSTRDVFIVVLGAAVLFSLASQGDTGSPKAQGAARAAPLDNPDGVRPGLAPLGSAGDRGAAVRLIKKLRVGSMGTKAGYSRARFGENWADTAKGVPYARNGCGTRNDLLARDGENVRYRRGSDCVVVSMKLRDPYTGRVVQWSKKNSDEIQVDHVVPLSYEWRMGASRWPMSKRMRIANDPLNLLPVYGDANEAKGGSGPASWLPPVRRVRCAYVVRFAQVALKYNLPVTRADKAVMLAQCR